MSGRSRRAGVGPAGARLRAPAPPLRARRRAGPFAEDDFGASRLVARTGALRAASAAAAAAAAAARGAAPARACPSRFASRSPRRVAAKETNRRERPLSAAKTSIEADAKSDAGRTIVARSSSVSSADAKSSAKLAAANAAREKAARKSPRRSAARGDGHGAAARVVAEAALVAATRRRRLARGNRRAPRRRCAESCALRAAPLWTRRGGGRAPKAIRVRGVAFGSGGRRARARRRRDARCGAYARAQGAARDAALGARRGGDARARESAAAERAAAMELEMACVAETWRASKLVAERRGVARGGVRERSRGGVGGRARLAPAERSTNARDCASPPSRVATETQTDAMTTETADGRDDGRRRGRTRRATARDAATTDAMTTAKTAR